MTGKKICAFSIILNCTAEELRQLNERVQEDKSTTEEFIKKAVCTYTQGALFCGDDVWGKRP